MKLRKLLYKIILYDYESYFDKQSDKLHTNEIKHTLYIVKLCDTPKIASMNNQSFIIQEVV